MFHDWDNIPSFLISESSLHQDTFNYFEAVSEMDDDRAEAFDIIAQISYRGQPMEMVLKKHWMVLMKLIRDSSEVQ
jgi:hypothetical protein